MLVQCPSCKTTYRVADEVVKGAAPAFRCSRCRHTFEIQAQSTSAAVRLPKTKDEAPSETNQELSFPFAEPQQTAGPVAKENGRASSEPPTGEGKAAAVNAPEREAGPIAETHAINTSSTKTPDAGQVTEPEKSADRRNHASATESYFGAGVDEEDEGPGQVLPMSAYVDQRASIFPYLTLFALLAVAFSLVAALGRAEPKFSQSLVQHIPLLGGMLLKNSHLKNGILIRSVRAGYQNIQGNREVLVVTGMALNQNPMVIREVQVTGRVYNDAGKELEQQTIWLGNTISPKIIRGMTSEDIPHLQNLKPLRSFEIPPGDSVPFTIVFLKALKGSKDFTCQVVSALAEA